MLQTKIKTNDVVTIKLVSGEEVIGRFVQEDTTSITLRKPVVPVPAGQQSMGLAPFVMSCDYLHSDTNNEIKFNKDTMIISPMLTNKQFADAYLQQTGGLDLSTSNPGLITP